METWLTVTFTESVASDIIYLTLYGAWLLAKRRASLLANTPRLTAAIGRKPIRYGFYNMIFSQSQTGWLKMDCAPQI